MDDQDRTVSARSAGISVQLQATSIYEHSLIRLTAKGCESFGLEFDEYITVFAVLGFRSFEGVSGGLVGRASVTGLGG